MKTWAQHEAKNIKNTVLVDPRHVISSKNDTYVVYEAPLLLYMQLENYAIMLAASPSYNIQNATYLKT